MSANRILLDGRYAAGFYVGRGAVGYPFRGNGDTRSLVVTRQWRVRATHYVPATLGVDRDPAFPDAYIIAESDPQPTGFGDVMQTTRVFARIPETQRTPATIVVSKPNIPGDDTFPKVLGSYLVTQPDSTLPRFDAYYRQTVTSDTGAPGFYPTGGTYTLTFGGNTTGSLNYNDSAATVEAALDALTSVSNRGGVTLTGSYNSAGGFAVTFASYAQITIASGSLTGSGTLTEIETLTSGGYAQSVGAYFTPTVYTPTGNIASLVGGTSTTFLTTSPSSTVRGFIIDAGVGGKFTGGTFTLTINASTTAAIAYNATFSEIAAALNALGIGSFTVSAQTNSGITTGLNSTGTAIAAEITFNNNAPTGGTFTLTVGADTTGSLNYNDSASTVQTALNALTSVTNRGGCTVSGSLVSGFAIAFSNSVITANASSLTPAGSSISPSITDGSIGRTQSITFSSSTATRTLYIANHGITTANVLFLKHGSTYYSGILGSKFTVPDANTIRLLIAASDAYASVGTITEAGARTKANYQAGSVRVRGFRVARFYLPGVSTGITTASDIPIPSSAANDVDFLLAVFSGSTSLNVDVGDLERWRDGPILSISASEVSASDL